MEKIILALCDIKPLSLKELSILLSRFLDTIRKDYINEMVEQEKLEFSDLESVRHPQQAYKTKVNKK